MNDKIRHKIIEYDFGQYLKDALSDQDMTMKRLEKLTKVPYWRITKQVTGERNINVREFLIIMETLKLSPNDLLKKALGKTNTEIQNEQFLRNLKSKEIQTLRRIEEIPMEYREVMFNMIENLIENFNIVISSK